MEEQKQHTQEELEIALVKRAILKADNQIYLKTYRSTANYILLANKASKVWSRYLDEIRKKDETLPRVFEKVIVIPDVIYNSDDPEKIWDLKAVKVGTNIVLDSVEGNEEITNEQPFSRDTFVNDNVKTITLKYVEQPEEDTVVYDRIFEYKKIKVDEK